MKNPDILTIGDIAKMCSVSTGTATKWTDSGDLKSHKLPGSTHRRVYRSDLYEFLNAHGIPLRGEDRVATRKPRILFVGIATEHEDALITDMEADADFDLVITAFQAGVSAGELAPDCVIVDAAGEATVEEIGEMVQFFTTCNTPCVIFRDYGDSNELDKTIFRDVFYRPYDRQLAKARLLQLATENV